MASSSSGCGGQAGAPQTACFEIDPKTGRPIDPTSGLPYVSPTRSPGDPAPHQPTVPTGGTGTDGSPTQNPDPTTPTNTPLPVPASGDVTYNFPCVAFLDYGPDAASFTFDNLDVTSLIKSAVQIMVSDYDPAVDIIKWVGLDCEGISYLGLGTPAGDINPHNRWGFTDSDGVKLVASMTDRRGIFGYSMLVRMDSDRGIGLKIGSGVITTTGNFAQSPNLGGVGPIGAAYCLAKICTAIITKNNTTCVKILDYAHFFANLNDLDCWFGGNGVAELTDGTFGYTGAESQELERSYLHAQAGTGPSTLYYKFKISTDGGTHGTPHIIFSIRKASEIIATDDVPFSTPGGFLTQEFGGSFVLPTPILDGEYISLVVQSWGFNYSVVYAELSQ